MRRSNPPSSRRLARAFSSRSLSLMLLVFAAALVATVAVGAFPGPVESADIGVTKTGADSVMAGANITYTITVVNSGPDPAANAALNDPLPAGTTFVSLSSPAGWSCTTPIVGANGTVNCTNASLAITSGDAFTLVVSTDVATPPGTFLNNTATVSTATADPNSENDASTASTVVKGPSADVGVTKSGSPGAVTPDSDITYTINVANNGPDPAANVALNDPLPGIVNFVSLSSPANWSCTTPSVGTNGTVNCTKSSLTVADGQQVFTLVGHVQSNATPDPNNPFITNQATVSTTTTDSNPDNDSAAGVTEFQACIPNPVVVTSADSGSGSLRRAIQDACVGGTISFDMSQVVSPITLTTAELLINKNLTVTGPGANLLTVQRSAAGGTPNFRIFEIQNGFTVNISGLTVSNGNLPGSTIGGGVFNSGTLTLTNSALSGNTAKFGSGIYNGGTLLTLTNSTVNGNNATLEGGGIFINAGTLTLTNSTVSGNSAPSEGGGIFNNGATVTLTNSTVSGNSATSNGGGIFNNGGTLTLKNTLVAGNFHGMGTTRDDVSGPIDATSSFNLIGDGTNMTGIMNGTNNNQVGSSGSPINAMLGALANNGGATQTHLLLPGSPAIDAGSNALAKDQNNVALTTDQRGVGFPRIVNTTVDIGAVEVNYAISATAGTPQSTPINSAFATLLKATVTESGNLESGIPVTFTPPASSASGAFTGSATVNTDGSGVATAPTFTANGTAGGPYNVVSSLGAGLATASFALTNLKGNQTITFGPLANKTFGDPDFVISPSASSGLPVALSATGQCTVTTPSPGTVHITAAGACSITASQAGNANYNPAANGQQNFTIGKANQTITFTALANKTFGDSDFNVSATASSGLTVSLAAGGQCTVTTPSPGTVHITAGGSCTITASQGGDSNYNPAASVPQSFNIAKVATATALSSSSNPSDLNQSVTFTATVTSGAGTPTGTAQFKDNGSAFTCSNAGGQTLNASGVATCQTSALTAGTHTITADYSGDVNFLGSTGTLSGGQVVRPQPSLSINDVSISEGDTGTKTLNFTVTLSAASNLTVNANFATANGTATAPTDYAATNGTLTFNPGDLTKTIPVTINGNTKFEPDKTFTVTLSSPTNATISRATGTGTILNDDAQGGFISFSQASYNTSENAGFVTITVNRTNDVSRPATVDYATDDTGAPASCGTVNGLASSRCDFTTAIGTLKFAATETQKTFTVLVNRDSYIEGPEMFTVNLSNPTGGAVLIMPSSATVTIADSPAGPPANLIDDPSFFVRQHYHDFLNREPDAPGLAFWTNQITSCGSDAQCTGIKRVNVSAAFFLSIEFQDTGGTAYFANKVAFGAVPSYSRFERDSQAVGLNYVFGAPGAAAILEANKVAYFNDFVNRPDFVSIYGFMSNGQYVDSLIANTKVSFTQAERDALVNGLNGGTETKATVLRKIAEKPSFRQAETNRMFVLMEYFGYLRRDPDSAGYSFWLNKLNQFNGNYVAAEMVKAFIVSKEYRQRFGP